MDNGTVTKLKVFNPRNPGKLETQADGREFAVRFLEAIESVGSAGGDDVFCAPATELDGEETWVNRERQQSQMIRQTFDTVYQTSEEVRRGFFTIITDQLGRAPGGWLDPAAYRQLEAQGLIVDEQIAK